MPTVLTSSQSRFLRGQAHDLKAMLQVGGKGITDTLIAEVDLALEHHERISHTALLEPEDMLDVMSSSYRGLRAREREKLERLDAMNATLSRDLLLFKPAR